MCIFTDRNVLTLEEMGPLLEILGAAEKRVVGLKAPISHGSAADMTRATPMFTSMSQAQDQGKKKMDDLVSLFRENTKAKINLFKKFVEGLATFVKVGIKNNGTLQMTTKTIQDVLNKLTKSVDELKLKYQGMDARRSWPDRPSFLAPGKSAAVTASLDKLKLLSDIRLKMPYYLPPKR